MEGTPTVAETQAVIPSSADFRISTRFTPIIAVALSCVGDANRIVQPPGFWEDAMTDHDEGSLKFHRNKNILE